MFTHLDASSSRSLLLIDEIFRGTNTAERVGGAAAVLNQLAQSNLTFVTTHDIELEKFLTDFEMFHFFRNWRSGGAFRLQAQARHLQVQKRAKTHAPDGFCGPLDRSGQRFRQNNLGGQQNGNELSESADGKAIVQVTGITDRRCYEWLPGGTLPRLRHCGLIVKRL
ncbi:MAG: hypothetical protein U5O39_10640 [Gammaproteobacteria bacterium]|nr:hypothetical protein [Gammaproteobacteria bacterium]